MTPLRERGAQAIADAWNAAAGPKYRIDDALVAQNLLDHPLFHEEASFWLDDAFVAVKRSAAGLYEGPDPEVAHLALFSPGAERLLPQVSNVLRGDGFKALVVGQDSGHFLPGAPTDVPWMGLLLKAHGFEPGGLAFDLERDLHDLPQSPADPDYDFRALREGDIDALTDFLGAEFPGRWRYDIAHKVEVEGPQTLFSLFREGRCDGFALLQNETTREPIGGAVWRADLGPSWGSLGPIGISSHRRGAGLGRTFLNRALVELRSRGVRRAIIDWTGLVDFYGTQGFSVNRAYRSYRVNLSVDRPRGE